MSIYKLSKKFTKKQRIKALDILEKSIKKGLNTSETIKELEKENLSYQRKNMLYDMRKKKSTYAHIRTINNEGKEIIKYKSLSRENRQKKLDFFDGIYETIRQRYNLDSGQMTDIINKWKDDSLTKQEIALYGREITDLYEAIFR